MNIDPLAELMPDQSPYNYAFNNPVFWIDPDGRMPEEGDAGGGSEGGSSYSGQTTYSMRTITPDSKEVHTIETTTNQLVEQISEDGKTKTSVNYTTTTRTDITKEKVGNNRNVSDDKPIISQSIVRSVETFSLDDDGNWVSNNDIDQVKLASTMEGEGLVNGDGFYYDNDFDTMVTDKFNYDHNQTVASMSSYLGSNDFGLAYSYEKNQNVNSIGRTTSLVMTFLAVILRNPELATLGTSSGISSEINESRTKHKLNINDEVVKKY